MRFNMILTGPDHMGIFLRPINGGNISNWSFHETPLRMNWPSPYFIYFSYGIVTSPLEFYLDVEVCGCLFLNYDLVIKLNPIFRITQAIGVGLLSRLVLQLIGTMTITFKRQTLSNFQLLYLSMQMRSLGQPPMILGIFNSYALKFTDILIFCKQQ